jgi:hypothetical protein
VEVCWLLSNGYRIIRAQARCEKPERECVVKMYVSALTSEDPLVYAFHARPLNSGCGISETKTHHSNNHSGLCLTSSTGSNMVPHELKIAKVDSGAAAYLAAAFIVWNQDFCRNTGPKTAHDNRKTRQL